MTPNYSEAVADIVRGAWIVNIWGRMGWAETRRRYRRTIIGPFWTSLSLAIFVSSMGFIWANLWAIDPKKFLPYLTSGMLAWLLLSSFINEGCMVFVSSEGLIKQLRVSYTMLICAMIWRNLIVFAHNLLIYVPVYIYSGLQLNAWSLMLAPGLIILCINGVWIALVLGLLCARYRDVQQVVASLMQISMFVTPIFWPPDQLHGRFRKFVDFNLLYHYVTIIRAPLLGEPAPAWSWIMVIIATVVGWSLAIYLFGRFQRRIAYWL